MASSNVIIDIVFMIIIIDVMQCKMLRPVWLD